MKKLSLAAWLFILLTRFTVTAQSTSDFFGQLGLNYNSFQDVKFSNVIYTGPGVSLGLGFEKENNKSVHGFGLNVNASGEFADTHEKGFTKALYPRVFVKYQRKIGENLSAGFHWDVLSFYYRGVEGLMNNGHYYQSGSDFLLSGGLKVGKFRFGANVGVLSFIKEGMGFAFSAPQNGLEKGEFDYQNDALANPVSLKYANVHSLNSRQVILTNASWQPGNRIRVGYGWELRRITNVPNHPATTARHTISLRYNFKHKEK